MNQEVSRNARQDEREEMSGLTIGDDEFGGLAELLDLTLLVHLVGLLVVDEEVGGALAAEPLVEN